MALPGCSSVTGLSGDNMVCVVDGFVDEPDEVPVAQGVDDVPAIFAGINQRRLRRSYTRCWLTTVRGAARDLNVVRRNPW